MKRFAMPVFLVTLMLACMTLIGCGAGSNPANINGNWNATLLQTNNGPTLYDFGLSLVVNGSGSLSVTNFQFSNGNQPSCFVDGETETGSFTLTGNLNGQVSGQFGLAVQASSPASNALTLSGTVNGNTITGTWALTGSTGCTGNGSFTMTKI
jgi:hypothetical protein